MELDPLPSWVLRSYELPALLPALRAMHQPRSEAQLEAARQRLAFQELLALQLKLLVQRNLAWWVLRPRRRAAPPCSARLLLLVSWSCMHGGHSARLCCEATLLSLLP